MAAGIILNSIMVKYYHAVDLKNFRRCGTLSICCEQNVVETIFPEVVGIEQLSLDMTAAPSLKKSTPSTPRQTHSDDRDHPKEHPLFGKCHQKGHDLFVLRAKPQEQPPNPG